MFKQKFKWTISTLRSDLFDAASPSQIQSNTMMHFVFMFKLLWINLTYH